jgi:hypothetical protein
MGTRLLKKQQNSNHHEEEILNVYRQAARRSMRYFSIVTFLSAVVLLVLSFIILIKNNKDFAFLILSTAVSLIVTLVFTVYYANVVDSALRQSESKAQSLEIEDVKKTISEEIEQSAQNISQTIEQRIQKMLDEEATRLVDTWPELLPKDYFPPSGNEDLRFTEKLGEAVAQAQHYMFRGTTGRFVPGLLQKYAKADLNCDILLIDPRATVALQVYAINRYGERTKQKSPQEYETDIQQEIYTAIVNLFDLRQRFHIEVRTCRDHLFYRSEIVDDGAFVSFYVGPIRTIHPPTYFYTRTKGTFYYAAFHKDFQQSWKFAEEQFAMRVGMKQDALEAFLIKIGAGDPSTIVGRIDEWRRKSAEVV